jgi:hypothetical protein
MSASCTVTISHRSVLAVPVEAVQFDENDQPYVELVSGSSVTESPVGTGESDASYVEITEGLSEGDQLDVMEKDGTIVLFPMAVYPTKYIEELKKEVGDIKAKIASGEQPVFDTVDALFESLEK